MYASVNTLSHKFNIYPLLNSIVYFVKSTFIKKTNLPFISIFVFIIAVVLNSIQYSKNDTNFLQDNTTSHKTNKLNQVTLSNLLLYIYDFIGINGFLSSGLTVIIFLIITYSCLALIEMNIGHVAILFLLLIDIMFQISIGEVSSALCRNYINQESRISNSPYCCGSFVQYMSIGFILYLTYKNINSKLYKGIIIFLILSILLIFQTIKEMTL